MILVDANLLLYARLSSFAEHERARTWLDDQLNGETPVGLPWPSLLAFVRVAINPRVFTRPLSPGDAWKQVQDWLACPPVWTPTPGTEHRRILDNLFATVLITPNLVGDAHLAALAIENDLTMCSADADFSKFPHLLWKNPLIA